ncbi:Hsp70 family protein [Streptomyces sp. NPDC005133]
MPYRTLGIDLGTTNSVTAWLHGGVPTVLPNRHGELSTPSAVGADAHGTLLVGREALNSRGQLPGSVNTEVKRLIGRRWDEEEVQALIRKRPVDAPPVRAGADGSVEIRLGEHYLTPVQVSAILLRRLKRDAESAAGEPFPRAVITVPAYFSEPQIAAVREAGRLAGFVVTRVLPEPTAAAHAFGVQRDISPDNPVCMALVYDLGGGTFDVSLLTTGPGYLDVVRLGGDKSLGGSDFDTVLDRHLSTRLGDRDHSAPGDASRIRAAAERTKVELSSVSDAEVVLAPLGHNGGSWSGQVKRADLEELIASDIDRTLAIVDDVLREASALPEDIDRVLLVGGSTHIPLVHRLLAGKFGPEKVSGDIDPMLAVALGAAVESGLLSHLSCPSERCLKTEIPLSETSCPDCSAPLLGGPTVDCPRCHVPAAEWTAACPVCAHDLSGLRAEAPVAARAVCPHCDCRQNSTSATVCQDCDEPLDVGGLKCPECAMVNATGLTACSACGTSFNTDLPEQVTAQALGLALTDGTVAVLFPAATRYPTPWRSIETLQVRPDGAAEVTFRVVEGPHLRSAERNEFCGQFTHQIDDGVQGAAELALRVRLDDDRTIHLAYRLSGGEERGARLRRTPIADKLGREAAGLLTEIRTHMATFPDELKPAERAAFDQALEQLSAIGRGEPIGQSLDGFVEHVRDTFETCREARSAAATAYIGARKGNGLLPHRLIDELADARSAVHSARERMDLPAMRTASDTVFRLWRGIDAAVRTSILTIYDAELDRFPETVRQDILAARDDLHAAAERGDHRAQDALHVRLNELSRRTGAPTGTPVSRATGPTLPERR